MVKNERSKILINKTLLIVSLILFISQAGGEIPSHIDPANVTRSDDNLKLRQAMIMNDLLSHWSGVFISLNKGDIKSAQDNFEQYLDILQQNNNILIEIEGGAYEELKESGNTFNLTLNQVEKLRTLYEEGKIAYQNNQTQKAIQIAIEARYSVKNLSALQEKFLMDSVEQFPGINISDYRTGSLEYDAVLENLSKRWRPVELTLFDDSAISLSVRPKEGQFGQIIQIDGAVTMPRNRTGVKNATVVIKINGSEEATVVTNKTGNFSYRYAIPYKKPGKNTVNVEFIPASEPLLSSFASSSFTLIPTNTTLIMESKPDSGFYGDILTISGALLTKNGTGIPDADISFSFGNSTVGNVKTDINGTYSYDFYFEANTEGYHSLKAEFIPDDQPLFSSMNTTSFKLMSTNTSIKIIAPGTINQDKYLNISLNLTTENGYVLNESIITVFLDGKEIGKTNINRNKPIFSYWINKEVQKGKHELTVRYAGTSLFQPSEGTKNIEILGTEFNYKILYAGIIGIIICIYLIRRTKIKSAQKPETIPETFFKEEVSEIIKIEEQKPVEIQSAKNQNDRENEIEDLIAKSKFEGSILLSYKTIQNNISEKMKIDNWKYLTHREFFDRVKESLPVITEDMMELSHIYENAMFSGIGSNRNDAQRALGSVKRISSKLENETQS